MSYSPDSERDCHSSSGGFYKLYLLSIGVWTDRLQQQQQLSARYSVEFRAVEVLEIMAQPQYDPTSYPTDVEHRRSDYGGNAAGAPEQQQQQRPEEREPGMDDNVRTSWEDGKPGMLLSGTSDGRQPSPLPGGAYRNEAQKREGNPQDAYRSNQPVPQETNHVMQQHYQQALEPHGVGEQGADTVIPRARDSIGPVGHDQPTAAELMGPSPGHNANPYRTGDAMGRRHEGFTSGAAPPTAGGDEHLSHTSPLVHSDNNAQQIAADVPRGPEEEESDRTGEKSGGVVGKLGDLITGQKPGHGSATGRASSDPAGTPDGNPNATPVPPGGLIMTAPGQSHQGHAGGHSQQQHPVTNPGNTPGARGATDSGDDVEPPYGTVGRGYVQDPSPLEGGADCLGKAKQKLGFGAHSRKGAQAGRWAEAAKPDCHNQPGAVETYTNEEGKPVARPEEGDEKKEGLMTKLMDKLHIGHQHQHQQQQQPDHPVTPIGAPTTGNTR